ncbi:hypothetical protein FRC04_002945 [Tulasnella sp. 424]|nr:hypothetical protein FRC04_002945 [Tulasnella sp. 424]
MESFDHLWKEIVHVLATTALIWVGQEPPALLQLSPPTPTQPLNLVIPTVTVYSPSRCLPVGAYPSTLGNSSSLDAEFLHRILVILFGLSIFGFSSLALGAFCLSFRATRSSSHPHTSFSSNVSPTLALSVEDRDDVTVRAAHAELEMDHCEIAEELSVKIENLEHQITAQASDIQFLKFNHECELATTWSAFERQKSQSAASYRASEVQSRNTIAYLHARIAQLEKQAVNQATIVHQLKTTHKQELETTEAKNQSTIQTLTTSHESKTNGITKDLVEMQALTTRLDAQLHTALNENTALTSSNARLAELESSQSTTITDLTVQLESTSNQLKDASAEKKSAQDRLAATEAELESISTRLYDVVREHTFVVRQKDDMITRNSEKIDALESKLTQQCDKTAELAAQIDSLNTEISAKDETISALTSSLSTATSKILDLETKIASNATVTAEVSVQTDGVEEDNEDAHTEVEFEGETSLDLLTASNSLARSISMTLPSPTSSPGALVRRHSLTGIHERAKQSSEDGTATSEEESDATATEPDDVAADEAAVEEALVVAIPESTEPSTSAVETGGPALPEEGLSASMWAPSVRPVKHELPARPQVNWAVEAASRKGQSASKNHYHTPQTRNEERPRWGKDRQGFTAFNTAQRVASGKAGGIKVTKNSKKDVRSISKETDYKFHDYR